MARFCKHQYPTLLLWTLILAYVLFFSAYSLQRHATLHSFAADLSYIDQPMWNTLHGHFLERTLGDRQVSRMAEHLEPIIVPVAFVFYLWDDVRAILIVQTVALALGALPVYWIAKSQISNHKSQISNLQSEIIPPLFVFVYLIFPALQAANIADFHADPFVVAPLLFAFWYATQRRYRAMWVWAIVAMLVKENLPTMTFMLGIFLLLSPRDRELETEKPEDNALPTPYFLLSTPWLTRSRLHGLALMAVSLAWFYVATFLIVAPLARQVYGSAGPIYLVRRYPSFGDGLAGLLAMLTESDRLRYLAGLFASVGWLALLAPEYLLLGLPVLVANTLSNFPGQYSGEQHYSAPLAPVFVIAAIYGFRRLASGLSGFSRFRQFFATTLRRYAATALVIWLLAWSLGYHYLHGWTPLARDFDWPQLTPHHQLLARFADQIPPDAPLSTTPPLHPHFAHRQKIYVFPVVADADFVLLDVSGVTDAHPNDVRATFDALVKSGEFGVVDAADGYVLLSRQPSAVSGQLPDAFYDFARAKEARPQHPAEIEFGGQLRFLGYDVVDDPKWRQTHLRLYWQALAPLPGDLRLWPFIFSDDGFLIEDTSQRPMVAPLWYPPAQWRPGETLVAETLPWDLGPRFNLGLAVLHGVGSDPAAAFADPAQRVPVTAAGPGVIQFHGGTWAQIGAFARDGHYLALVSGDPTLSPLDVTFAEGIHLTGFQISDLQSSIPNPQSPIQNPKSRISIVLQWQPTLSVSRDYTVFVHLVAPDGAVAAQSDARPAWVVPWPTDRWSPGQLVLDGHRILLPPDLPPGRYQVRAGLYYWETMQRLPVLDEAMQPVGDSVLLGEVTVEAGVVRFQQ